MKYFWDFFITMPMRAPDRGRTRKVTRVISQLMLSIHDENADDGGRRSDHLGHALVEGHAHGVHVVGDAREHLAVGLPVEILERQPVDLFESSFRRL
jgi:hypothetical protein